MMPTDPGIQPCPTCHPVFPDHREVATVLDGALLPAGAAVKPPTQVAGVKGIDAPPVMREDSSIDWVALANLPPFQMWAAERLRSEHPGGRDSREHALDVIRRLGMGCDVFDEYAAWHAAKGYWPTETPTGKMR